MFKETTKINIIDDIDQYIKDYSIAHHLSSFKLPIINSDSNLKLITVKDGNIIKTEDVLENPENSYFNGNEFKKLPQLKIKIDGGLLYASFGSDVILKLNDLNFDDNLNPIKSFDECKKEGEKTIVKVNDYKRYNNFKIYNQNEDVLPPLYFECIKNRKILKRCPLKSNFNSSMGKCEEAFSLSVQRNKLKPPKCFNGLMDNGFECKDPSCREMDTVQKIPFNTFIFNFENELFAGFTQCSGGREVVKEICDYNIQISDYLQHKIIYPSKHFSITKMKCVDTQLYHIGKMRIDGEFVYKAVEGTIGIQFYRGSKRESKQKFIFMKPTSDYTDKIIPIFDRPKSYLLNGELKIESTPLVVYRGKMYKSPYSYSLLDGKCEPKVRLVSKVTKDVTLYATLYGRIIFDIVIALHTTRINMKTFNENIENMKEVILDDFYHYPVIYKYLLESNLPNFIYYNVKNFYNIDCKVYKYDTISSFFNDTFSDVDKFEDLTDYLLNEPIKENNYDIDGRFILENDSLRLFEDDSTFDNLVKLVDNRLNDIKNYILKGESSE